MTESLWTALHTTKFFHSFPFSSPWLFIFFVFLQQWAGLVRSGSPTISPRCALPSCCFALIKELLNEWLGCTESLVENNISLTEAQSCMSMTANGQWENLTHGICNILPDMHEDREPFCANLQKLWPRSRVQDVLCKTWRLQLPLDETQVLKLHISHICIPLCENHVLANRRGYKLTAWCK